MTLPTQPSAENAIKKKQSFYRICQEVGSPGAIYEIDISTLAVYIGSLSDVAEVRLAWLDSVGSPTNQMQMADVSVGGPFVGRMDALLDTSYPQIGQTARILAWPVDMVDPAYVRPTGPGAAPARRENFPTLIDLMCVTELPTVIPSRRADRTFRLPRVPFNNAAAGGNDGSTDLYIPIHGRRFVTVQIQTPVATPHIDSYYLVALQPGTTQPFAKFLGDRSYASVSVQQTDTVVFRASDQIARDEITATGTTSVPTTFDWTENAGPPLPAVKGLGDMLCINIKPDFAGMPPAGYSLASYFIKVSDREQ